MVIKYKLRVRQINKLWWEKKYLKFRLKFKFNCYHSTNGLLIKTKLKQNIKKY